LRRLRGLLLLVACAGAGSASAYGVEGHLIAGRVAATRLCPRAAAAVDRLGDGRDLGEIGLWADRIRSDPDHAESGPWHYVNLTADERLADLRHPPEGDVLWAIAHFGAQLADAHLDDATRAEALRFLVHFIVDIHQPLHAGRAIDRGGNGIALRFRGEATNLHRLWDTDAIRWRDASLATWIADVGRRADAIDGEAGSDPLKWTEESRELLDAVYDFGRPGGEPSPAYLNMAASITRDRLALASVRLAGSLNAIFCTL
jgi:hypothetical protein